MAVVGREPLQLLLGIFVAVTVITTLYSHKHYAAPLLVFIPCTLIDFTFHQLGIFQFNPDIFPAWLALLWLAFIWYLNEFQSTLNKVPIALQFVLGAILGPVSYWAASALGAVTWPRGLMLSMTILSLCWAALLPSLSMLFKQSDKP